MTREDRPIERELVVLFVDVADSTRIYGRLGDSAGRETIVGCLDLLAARVAEHDGEVVDRIGDELMCRFASARSALDAALAMQDSLDAARRSGELPDVHVRVGLHGGPVLCSGTNLSGETVHLANRLVGLAKAGQVAAAKETLQQIPPDLLPPVRFLESVTLKGTDGVYDVFEVLWGSGLTLELSDSTHSLESTSSGPEPRLEVGFAGETLQLGHARTTVTIGRVPPADLVVDSSSVSRLHARIELRRKTFYLVDVSTNGSRIDPERGGALFLRRDELPLRGVGTIVVGPGDADAEERPISFRCLS